MNYSNQFLTPMDIYGTSTTTMFNSSMYVSSWNTDNSYHDKGLELAPMMYLSFIDKNNFTHVFGLLLFMAMPSLPNMPNSSHEAGKATAFIN